MNFFDWSAERDETLIKGLCQAARTTRMELREWVQAELNASLVETEVRGAIADGIIRDNIRKTEARLRTINHRDLPEAVSSFDDLIDEVLSGGFENVYDAYDQLQQGCVGLMRIMNDLLEIRRFIGEM